MPRKALDIKISNYKKTQKYLDDLGDGFREEVEDTMEEAVIFFQSKIPEYPTRPYETSYDRTGRLGESLEWVGSARSERWSIYDLQWMGDKLEAIVGSKLPYAIWVIDEDQQAYMHQTGYKGFEGWWIIQEVFTENIDGIVKVFERRLGDYVENP